MYVPASLFSIFILSHEITVDDEFWSRPTTTAFLLTLHQPKDVCLLVCLLQCVSPSMSVDVSPLPPGRFLSACSWCNSLCLAVFVCMSVYTCMCVCLYICLYVRLFACLCLSVRLPGIQMLTEK